MPLPRQQWLLQWLLLQPGGQMSQVLPLYLRGCLQYPLL